MSDAKRVSQLISMSLRYRLSEAEAAEVDQPLSSDEQSRRFAELSKLIQSSVTHGANLVETDTTAGSGLSTEAFTVNVPMSAMAGVVSTEATPLVSV